MIQVQANPKVSENSNRRKAAIGIWAIFITQFVSYLFINARNIAIPVMINEFNGMQLFAWLIALPALTGAASTLLFGKLSDLFGRRMILLLCIVIFLVGLGISARSTSMVTMVAAATFMSIGHFPIIPLCFTSIGDLFPPSERAKWTGLLNLPGGIAALIGPVLGGLIAESVFGWRGIYWGTIPLMLIGAGLAMYGLSGKTQKNKVKIDVAGTIMMVVATATLILGFSWLGKADKIWWSLIILSLSLVAWFSFIKLEMKAEAPILDPQIFQNRTFMTAAAAAFLSYFGMLGISSYSPIFVQNVMKIDPTLNGSMLTPYLTIVAFLGIPAGFLLARTKKYKWMYIGGYAIVTFALFAMWRFTINTPIWLYILITSIAGFGLGTIPTINTLVAQFSVPKRLIGVAVGAIYFFQMIGISVAPSLLGLAQNRSSNLEGGLKTVFLIGAITMLVALILITTIPEISMNTSKEENL
jgi:MFS family permease